jgi:hypothetical protein
MSSGSRLRRTGVTGIRMTLTLLLLVVPALVSAESNSGDGVLSRSFEFRYFSDEAGADGETDFKGETEIFDTEQRVDFLAHYGDYAKRYFHDPDLNRKAVSEDDITAAMLEIKPQPLPHIRTRVPLDDWKWLGFREGQCHESAQALATWGEVQGVAINDKALVVTGDTARFARAFQPQSWRFSCRWNARVPRTDVGGIFSLSDKERIPGMEVGFNRNGTLFYSSGDNTVECGEYLADTWYEFKVEVDIPDCRYNLYINDVKVADYVPLQSPPNNVGQLNTITVQADKGLALDSLWGVGYSPTQRVRQPYLTHTFIDETFESKPSIDAWQAPAYDDACWGTTGLPRAHGSERHAEEDLYLRREVYVGDFERAVLNVEALDPSGEVWVNGSIVAVLPNRHPANIDISSHLRKNSANLIAVKVNHFYLTDAVGQMMGHSSLDFSVGWFAGRMSLDLTSRSFIGDVFTYTTDIADTGDSAELEARFQLVNEWWYAFRGQISVNVYPWFPEEGGSPVATAQFPVLLAPGDHEITHAITIPEPELWTTDTPTLYKVEVILQDDTGAAVDDFVLTTGIRTIDQDGGTFHINGQPAMLNGAQIMGFRSPIDKLVTWQRSAPLDWLIREILMIKNMNGNMMRIHVHAWENGGRNINDPRLAELGDQMGIMFIWGTPSWIRTGKGWGQIDFKGYPKYMRQVYNHPSIVMWEASNHPQRIQDRDVSESALFCETIYNTIYPVDSSRLISTTSYINHLHYATDDGTLDHDGNSIVPSPAWTAPMMTRGNQDHVTGYGHEWSVLRELPNVPYIERLRSSGMVKEEFRKYLTSFLDSKERAYFNFEHEESIGQPNWNLAKGKPWYRLQSYEWEYDIGSIGRNLTADEWLESQAWQAFSAFESMKKQRMLDFDGFSWCCLHGGPNSATYKKPIIDYLGHVKLSWYINRMALQNVLAGSGDVDVVYSPGDRIRPMVLNLGPEQTVSVEIMVKDMDGAEVFRKTFDNVTLPGGRTVTDLPAVTPDVPTNAYYAIEYTVTDSQ